MPAQLAGDTGRKETHIEGTKMCQNVITTTRLDMSRETAIKKSGKKNQVTKITEKMKRILIIEKRTTVNKIIFTRGKRKK